MSTSVLTNLWRFLVMGREGLMHRACASAASSWNFPEWPGHFLVACILSDAEFQKLVFLLLVFFLLVFFRESNCHSYATFVCAWSRTSAGGDLSLTLHFSFMDLMWSLTCGWRHPYSFETTDNVHGCGIIEENDAGVLERPWTKWSVLEVLKMVDKYTFR